jgi:hypothetical protein
VPFLRQYPALPQGMHVIDGAEERPWQQPLAGQIAVILRAHLTFRSDNRFQPVVDALAVLKQYLGTKVQYLPDSVPIEGVVLPRWRDTVIEPKDDKVRINRMYYELCVLQQLERALRCKEIWVEGQGYYFDEDGQRIYFTPEIQGVSTSLVSCLFTRFGRRNCVRSRLPDSP